MKKVHTLPPEIISKIAAGEVIDRPASIVKELLENALDAGTDSIELRFKKAGKTSIQIKDRGHGISQEDIAKIFKRHSTSKIQTLEDLFHIHSLGFRGEALYSIAAVSDVTLKSKTQDQDTGWEIHLRGNEQLSLKPVSMTTGTEIDIQEIFYNTPARKKFLKSDTTETNQILNTLIPYALFYPQIRFFTEHQGKILLNLTPTDDHAARIAETLNIDKNHLIELKHAFPEKNLSIRMFLGDINIIRSRRDMQFIFINQRPVLSKSISFHMNNIYRLLLPPGHYPFFFLSIDMPPEDIDVNVHPSKREVKIKNEQDICSLLRYLSENALMKNGQAKQTMPPSDPSTFSKIERALSEVHHPRMNFDQTPECPGNGTPSQRPTEEYTIPGSTPGTFSFKAQENLFGEKTGSLLQLLEAGRFIGSFRNKFLLFEAGRSLLVVDQHAAQERITFEKLLRQMEKGGIESQNLLSPYLLKLTPQEFIIWEEAAKTLQKCGFVCTQFDEETLAVQSHPVLIKDPLKAVRDMLAGDHPARCDFETIARRACRASIMSGDKINSEQAEFQRQELLQCQDPFTCPHGRPIVVEMTENFLDKQFLRT